MGGGRDAAPRTTSSISTTIASSSRHGSVARAASCAALINRAVSDPKRVVFPEGEEPKIIRAARICVDDGIAEPILLGNREAIEQQGARA